MKDQLANMIPFGLATMANGSRPKMSVSAGRIIEALIIGVISGVLSSYIAIQKIEVRLTEIEKRVFERLEAQHERILTVEKAILDHLRDEVRSHGGR